MLLFCAVIILVLVIVTFDSYLLNRW